MSKWNRYLQARRKLLNFVIIIYSSSLLGLHWLM